MDVAFFYCFPLAVRDMGWVGWEALTRTGSARASAACEGRSRRCFERVCGCGRWSQKFRFDEGEGACR
jgi:hypothetical protein